MRDDYQPGVLANEKRNRGSSEIAARDAFNRKHAPLKGLVVPHDLRKMDLPERPWRNNRGHWFDLADYEVLNAHLAELKPGSASVRHRHTTEAVIYIVRGVGHTIISWDGVNKQRIDWEEGDMFSFPVWMWHQHFNDSETEVARYLAVQDTFSVKALGLHQIERFPEGQ